MLQCLWTLPFFSRRWQCRNMAATVGTGPAARNDQGLHYKRLRDPGPYGSVTCARRTAEIVGMQRLVEKDGLECGPPKGTQSPGCSSTPDEPESPSSIKT